MPVMCKKQILPYYLSNLVCDGGLFLVQTLKSCISFFTGSLFYSVTPTFLTQIIRCVCRQHITCCSSSLPSVMVLAY